MGLFDIPKLPDPNQLIAGVKDEIAGVKDNITESVSGKIMDVIPDSVKDIIPGEDLTVGVVAGGILNSTTDKLTDKIPDLPNVGDIFKIPTPPDPNQLLKKALPDSISSMVPGVDNLCSLKSAELLSNLKSFNTVSEMAKNQSDKLNKKIGDFCDTDLSKIDSIGSRLNSCINTLNSAKDDALSVVNDTLGSVGELGGIGDIMDQAGDLFNSILSCFTTNFKLSPISFSLSLPFDTPINLPSLPNINLDLNLGRFISKLKNVVTDGIAKILTGAGDFLDGMIDGLMDGISSLMPTSLIDNILQSIQCLAGCPSSSLPDGVPDAPAIESGLDSLNLNLDGTIDKGKALVSGAVSSAVILPATHIAHMVNLDEATKVINKVSEGTINTISDKAKSIFPGDPNNIDPSRILKTPISSLDVGLKTAKDAVSGATNMATNVVADAADMALGFGKMAYDAIDGESDTTHENGRPGR